MCEGKEGGKSSGKRRNDSGPAATVRSGGTPVSEKRKMRHEKKKCTIRERAVEKEREQLKGRGGSVPFTYSALSMEQRKEKRGEEGRNAHSCKS